MTEVGLFLWQVVLWGGLGLLILFMTVAWLFVAYAVVRTVAEFIKAYKEAEEFEDTEDF